MLLFLVILIIYTCYTGSISRRRDTVPSFLSVNMCSLYIVVLFGIEDGEYQIYYKSRTGMIAMEL
jgi:p-aminobenzoyl-glutamate transporter AbgT